MSLSDQIREMTERLKATDINGCIVGSSLTGREMESWSITPDIDIFTYSPYSMVHALDVCEYQLGLKPGGDSITTDKGEKWKVDKCRIDGRGNRDLATCKFTDGDVTVNISNRRYERSAMDVIGRFDMSIVLVAYDIQSKTTLDMREVMAKSDVAEIIGFKGGDRNVAIPNPFRGFDGTTWNASKWLRQWDRVIKYWDRGFDTRPMARFYLNMIDEVVEGGTLFKTDASKAAYEEFCKEFADLKVTIENWIKENE